jgi:hypothetical protein
LTVSNGNSYDFHVRANDAQGSSAYSSTSTFTVTIITNTCSGSVTAHNSSGHGVSGVTIVLQNNSGGWHDDQTYVTGTDGTYTFDYAISSGQYRLVAASPDFTFNDDDGSPNDQSDNFTSGNPDWDVAIEDCVDGFVGTSVAPTPPNPPASPLSGITVTGYCAAAGNPTTIVTTTGTDGYFFIGALGNWTVGGDYYSFSVTPTDVNYQFVPSTYLRGYGRGSFRLFSK